MCMPALEQLSMGMYFNNYMGIPNPRKLFCQICHWSTGANWFPRIPMAFILWASLVAPREAQNRDRFRSVDLLLSSLSRSSFSYQLLLIEAPWPSYNMRFFNHVSQAYPPKPSFTEKGLPDLRGKVSTSHLQSYFSIESINNGIGLCRHRFQHRHWQRARSNSILKARQGLCRVPLTGEELEGDRGD